MKNAITYKITLTAVLSALSLIAFIIESLFPPLFVPGAKLGLGNIFVLLATVLIGWRWGFLTVLIKTVLGSLIIGNISATLYSLPAGVLALTAEILLLLGAKRFSIVAISVSGAVINATLQNVVFCIITGNFEYFAYLPYLALIGVFAGLVVGFAVWLIIKYLPSSLTNKLYDGNESKIDDKENLL